MRGELIFNKIKICYRVFDKSYKDSTHIYSKHKAANGIQLVEIDDNLQKIKQSMDGDGILVLKQVHGNIILDTDEISDFSLQPEADGAITTKNKIILAVQTADCVPLLLASEQVIGVAHCGWKGAKADIITNLVLKMNEKGTQAISAFIGPSIKHESYEVDENYYQNFLSDNKTYDRFFINSSRQNYYMFDLPGFVISKLKELNINDITISPDNTYKSPAKYPSFRYFTHNNMPYNQNILSTIMIM